MSAAAATSISSTLGDAMNARPMLCIQHTCHVLKGHYLHLHMCSSTLLAHAIPVSFLHSNKDHLNTLRLLLLPLLLLHE